MSEHPFKSLAQRLASNPNYLEEVEEEALRELLLNHSQKLLSADLGQEMDELIRTNTLAALIWREFQASDDHLETASGREWVEGASKRALSKVLLIRKGGAVNAPAKVNMQGPLLDLIASLQVSISSLFASHFSLVTASGREGLERTLKDGKTRIALKSDSAGRLWLQVTSTAGEFAGRSFQVGVEPTPALLSFSEVTPGVHNARVCVSDELAAALSSGGELKLTPILPD